MHSSHLLLFPDPPDLSDLTGLCLSGLCGLLADADQMVADAWLALDNVERTRFAPIMGAFNPTDGNAVEHVRRMWEKYPGMWRGIGGVTCRDDDLTTLLQEQETPVINHRGMKAIYEFCIEKDINCLVHHNSDRPTNNGDGTWDYVWEVEQVLQAFPALKLIWCHSGVSRRTSKPNHFDMLDRMLSKYSNLTAHISWVSPFHSLGPFDVAIDSHPLTFRTLRRAGCVGGLHCRWRG